MSDELRPIALRRARAFVNEHHRHNVAPQGWLFGVQLVCGTETVGVGIAGRPIARMADDGRTVEITRLTLVEGAPKNAATRLYGALCRAAKALGYLRAITYTLGTGGHHGLAPWRSASGKGLRGRRGRAAAMGSGRLAGGAALLRGRVCPPTRWRGSADRGLPNGRCGWAGRRIAALSGGCQRVRYPAALGQPARSAAGLARSYVQPRPRTDGSAPYD